MRILRRTVPAALCALVCGALLVAAMVGPAAPSLRRLPLTILGVVALAIFAKPSRRLSVAALIPVGPVLDAFFLTPGREIYATEVVLLAALIGWAGRRALAAPPWPRLPLAIRLWLAFAVVGVLALGLGLTAATPDPSWLRGVRLLVLAAGVPLDHPRRRGRPRFSVTPPDRVGRCDPGGIARDGRRRHRGVRVRDRRQGGQ